MAIGLRVTCGDTHKFVSEEVIDATQAHALMVALLDDPHHRGRVMVSVTHRSPDKYVVQHPYCYNGDAERVNPRTHDVIPPDDPTPVVEGEVFYYCFTPTKGVHDTSDVNNRDWPQFLGKLDAYAIAMRAN